MREGWNDPNSHACVDAYIKEKPGSVDSVLVLIKFSTQEKSKMSYENSNFDQ